MACPVKCATVPRFRVAVPSAHGVRCTNPGLFALSDRHHAKVNDVQIGASTGPTTVTTIVSGSRSVHDTGDLLWAVNRRPGMGGPIFTASTRSTLETFLFLRASHVRLACCSIHRTFRRHPRPCWTSMLRPPDLIFHEALHSGIQAKRSSRCSAINPHIGKSAAPRWIQDRACQCTNRSH